MSAATQQPKLERTMFSFSRTLEYFDAKELQAQTGQAADNFPSVVVKELVDNALDECESLKDVTPEVKLTVNEVNDGKLEIKVSDNGKGIPSELIDRILDFNTRTTSKAFYRCPTRGQMGNALKTIFGIPFALSQLSEENTVEPIIIESQGVKHTIDIKADPTGELKLNHDIEPTINNVGTCITTVLEPKIRYFGDKKELLITIEKLCMGYGIFNPHINFEFEGKVIERRYGEIEEEEEYEVNIYHKYPPIVDEKWRKFYPTDLPSPHWYSSDDLNKLIYAHINNGKIKPFGEFIREFRGLSDSAKAKIVKAEFPGIKTIANIVEDETQIPKLLKVMQAAAKPPSPSVLGIIGEESVKQRITSIHKVEQFWYSIKKGTQKHIPFIAEVASITTSEETGKRIIAGLNFTPTYDDPFKNTDFYITKKNKSFSGYGLSGLLSNLKITSEDNFILMVHLTYPVLEFSERAKSTVILPSDKFGDEDLTIREAIGEAVYACCREFSEHKRREEKDAEKEERKLEKEREERNKAEKRQKWTLKDAVFEVLPEALDKVSKGRTLPFSNRQFFYVVRDLIQRYDTEKELKDGRFSGIIKEYQEEYGKIEGLYKEPRGDFHEPHTGVMIPLGTREVCEYIIPKYLFNKILYVEKRGFMPLFKQVKLLEKYDMGVAASQGYAVDACKELLGAKTASYDEKITILILHDCDADGLMIAENLKEELKNSPIEVIDVGFFIEDVIKKSFPTEKTKLKKRLAQQLKDTLTEEQQRFLLENVNNYTYEGGKKVYEGKRVELNVLTPKELVDYIEDKLREHNLTKKVCPPDAVIKKEASDVRSDRLDENIRSEINVILNIQTVISNIRKQLIDKIDLSDVPGYLKENLKEKSTDRWKEIVERKVIREVIDVVNENEKLIKHEIYKNLDFEEVDK